MKSYSLLHALLTVILLMPLVGHSQDMTSSVESAKNISSEQSSPANQSDENKDSEALNNENQDNELNFSESIPIDEIVGSWEVKYRETIKDWGIEQGVFSNILLSTIIITILFIGIYIAKNLAKSIRKLVYEKTKRFHFSHRKLAFYERAFRWFFNIILITLATSALLFTWDISMDSFISSEIVMRAIANVITIFFIVILGSIIIEIVSNIVERFFMRWGSSSQSRIDTLLPIARNTVYTIFITIFSLMLLAELGVKVMPLLAGAGVLGFAVGFGAQTIIKDLLTGFIIILEDLIQVGDIVKLADRTGIVEKITIRKVQLRNLDGTVYTVPFSEISIVENLTKEYSYALMEIGIAYREDVDEVSNLLKSISEELSNDEDYKESIIENIEILGLDKFADSAVVIKARIKTKPAEQWRVGREYNRRMKIAFDKHNIEIPFPHQTIYFGEDKKGNAPPLQINRLKAAG